MASRSIRSSFAKILPPWWGRNIVSWARQPQPRQYRRVEHRMHRLAFLSWQKCIRSLRVKGSGLSDTSQCLLSKSRQSSRGSWSIRVQASLLSRLWTLQSRQTRYFWSHSCRPCLRSKFNSSRSHSRKLHSKRLKLIREILWVHSKTCTKGQTKCSNRVRHSLVKEFHQEGTAIKRWWNYCSLWMKG